MQQGNYHEEYATELGHLNFLQKFVNLVKMENAWQLNSIFSPTTDSIKVVPSMKKTKPGKYN